MANMASEVEFNSAVSITTPSTTSRIAPTSSVQGGSFWVNPRQKAGSRSVWAMAWSRGLSQVPTRSVRLGRLTMAGRSVTLRTRASQARP